MCSLGPQEEPQIQIPCAGLRKVSPVACECLLSCLRAGEEVCGHASAGCDDLWKSGAPTATRTLAWNLTHRTVFHERLTCIAFPPGVTPASSFPLPAGAVLTTLALYSASPVAAYAAALAAGGGVPLPKYGPLPAYGAGLALPNGRLYVPSNPRAGGHEPSFGPNASWVRDRMHDSSDFDATTSCSTFPGSASARWGCSGRGRCLLQRLNAVSRADAPLVAKCVCVDGAYGANCEFVSSNNCVHDCSGRGRCVHGFCLCDAHAFGVDCSDTFQPQLAALPRTHLHADSSAFGPGPVGLGASARIDLLPPGLRPHVRRLRQRVFVYDLPPSINRLGDTFSVRYWGAGCFVESDPVHTRRIYASQAHFDGHLLHDDYVRTLDPSRAHLFYVPTFIMQRHTWGSPMVGRSMQRAYEYIRHAYPYWNRSGGRDHVWLMPGEKQTCDVPREILDRSIVVGHWGGMKGFTTDHADCVRADKDVVVPPITPIQHDLAEYRLKLQPAMARAEARRTDERSGPLLLFAGGIFEFGASQSRVRRRGLDTKQKQQRLLRKAKTDTCSKPTALPKYHPRSYKVRNCRSTYSMGVRGAIWRSQLYAEPDMKIVSAGIPNYLEVAAESRFCLHTEGNSWGTRMVDGMAIECIPLIVNDGMLLPYHNILSMETEYPKFTIHLSKEHVPTIPSVLRNVSREARRLMLRSLREHKHGFIWFRPEGLAYEYTLAALGERVVSFLGHKDAAGD